MVVLLVVLDDVTVVRVVVADVGDTVAVVLLAVAVAVEVGCGCEPVTSP